MPKKAKAKPKQPKVTTAAHTPAPAPAAPIPHLSAPEFFRQAQALMDAGDVERFSVLVSAHPDYLNTKHAGETLLIKATKTFYTRWLPYVGKETAPTPPGDFLKWCLRINGIITALLQEEALDPFLRDAEGKVATMWYHDACSKMQVFFTAMETILEAKTGKNPSQEIRTKLKLGLYKKIQPQLDKLKTLSNHVYQTVFTSKIVAFGTALGTGDLIVTEIGDIQKRSAADTSYAKCMLHPPPLALTVSKRYRGFNRWRIRNQPSGSNPSRDEGDHHY